MAGYLAELGPEDEVIFPAYTFVSTVLAFASRGIKPVLVDVQPDTFNIDTRLIEEKITNRTRAIVTINYNGVSCDYTEIRRICDSYGLFLVEDNAHGLGGVSHAGALGTFGDISVTSFHETKNVSCGEGGAITLNDPALSERAEILRDKGTNRSKFFRGEVDKYNWVDWGSSWVISDLLAEVLAHQLDKLDTILRRRREIWQEYYQSLGDWGHEQGVMLPPSPALQPNTAHVFFLVLPRPDLQEEFIKHMRLGGVHSVVHYQSIAESPMGKRLGLSGGQFPNAERGHSHLVRIPIFNSMTKSEVNRVIEQAQEFRVR